MVHCSISEKKTKKALQFGDVFLHKYVDKTPPNRKMFGEVHKCLAKTKSNSAVCVDH